MINITKKDLIWGYFSKIFQMGSGLFLLPLILKKLTSEEVGVWYIFLTITSLVNLLDFGLTPTITRNISYIFSGANNLSETGILELKINKKINFNLLKNFIEVIKKQYRFISIIMLFLLLSVGNIYIYNISSNLINFKQIMIAWQLYIVSAVFNFYFYYYTPLLVGRGLISKSNKTIIYTKVTFLLLSYIFLYLGFGLIGLAISNFLASFINRITSYYYFYDKVLETKLNKSIKYGKNETKKLLKILRHNSNLSGISAIGAFIILRGNLLLGSNFLNMSEIGRYGLTIQIYSLIVSVSMILYGTFLPKLNSDRILKSKEEFKKNVSNIYIITIILGVICLSGFLILGRPLLNIIGSNVQLYSNKILIFLSLIYILEINHSISAGIIMTKNEIPTAKSSIITGIIIVTMSYTFLKFTKLEVYSLFLSQFIGQAIYNNWKWPMELRKDLDIKRFGLLKLFMRRYL